MIEFLINKGFRIYPAYEGFKFSSGFQAYYRIYYNLFVDYLPEENLIIFKNVKNEN